MIHSSTIKYKEISSLKLTYCIQQLTVLHTSVFILVSSIWKCTMHRYADILHLQ